VNGLCSLAPKIGRGFHEVCADLRPVCKWVVYPGSETYPLRDGIEVLSPLVAADRIANGNC
jgi:hypothetical protein